VGSAPRLFNPREIVKKLFYAFLGEILKHGLLRILRNLVKELDCSSAVSGSVNEMMCVFLKETGFGILQTTKCLKASRTLLALGELIDHIKNIHSIGTAVLVNTHFSGLFLVLPKITAVCTVTEIMGFYDTVHFFDK
jgi:hypothetical protein